MSKSILNLFTINCGWYWLIIIFVNTLHSFISWFFFNRLRFFLMILHYTNKIWGYLWILNFFIYSWLNKIIEFLKLIFHILIFILFFFYIIFYKIIFFVTSSGEVNHFIFLILILDHYLFYSYQLVLTIQLNLLYHFFFESFLSYDY